MTQKNNELKTIFSGSESAFRYCLIMLINDKNILEYDFLDSPGNVTNSKVKLIQRKNRTKWDI